MVKYDPTSLQASRALNNLIAEEFMRLTPWPEQDPWKPGKLFKSRPAVPGEKPKPIEAPDYSGKIAPAWRVLEKLNRQHPVELKSDITGQWFVKFGKRSVAGESAPLAICRAALLSLRPAEDLPGDAEDY
ncbi:MAG: hypothetical protein EOP11_14070 [Proteobacteria bacterium]|nr:MAG: hypothetical protein EOP11_14070 [Pseudomonadota bacterium]